MYVPRLDYCGSLSSYLCLTHEGLSAGSFPPKRLMIELSVLYDVLLCNVCSVFSFRLKVSTRKLTPQHLLTGMKAIRSKIVATSPCSFPTQKTGDVVLKLAESRLTLLLPGFRFSLDLRL